LSVTSVDTDYDNLSVALIADFDAPIEQVWELWSDPRKLERWMGPSPYQANVEKHDLSSGGEIAFSMTGPDGDKHWGIWRVTAVDPPASLEYADSFADADGTPIADTPVSRVTVRLIERDGGTRMEINSTFDSRDEMEQWVSLGSVEGWRQAAGQMDALLE
jgi:uncharacterized protein YndB with AHSA1/START domain